MNMDVRPEHCRRDRAGLRAPRRAVVTTTRSRLSALHQWVSA